MKDIAKRFTQNPLLRPADLKAGIEGMMKRMIPEVKEVVAEAE